MKPYDLVVIGGGSGGLTAATIAGRVGAQVLLVDKQYLGGDCLHYGCVPSKALIRCANVAHTVRDAGRFGVKLHGNSTVDFSDVMQYVREAIDVVGNSDSEEVLRSRGVDVVFGGARFLSPTRIQVGDRQLEASRSIISVGSRAVAPPIPGLRKAGFIDHVGLFQLNEQPRRLVVIGGGPIGVEMGQAMARLGSEVTILERSDRLLRNDDEELARLLAAYLEEELTLLVGASVTEVRRLAHGKTVVFEEDGEQKTIDCDEILVATGRKPNLEELGLAEAGVDFNSKGIIVNDRLRTTAPNIWACGDCTGSYQFTHFAEAQARVATRNALFAGNEKFKEKDVPWTTFSDPEVAHVGMTEAQARAEHDPIRVYRFPYAELDRAVCDGMTKGLGKIVCDLNGNILGASLLGSHAGEAITEIVIAMKASIPLHKLAQFIHVYPTLGRIIRRLGDQRFLEEGVGRWTRKIFGRYRGEKQILERRIKLFA